MITLVLSKREKGSFRNVLNKFQIRGITVLIETGKGVSPRKFTKQRDRPMSLGLFSTLMARKVRIEYPSSCPVIPSHSELEYEDHTGLLISETLPDGGVKRYKYNKKGEKVFEYGTRTNPVKYEYDAQGRMIKMWTYKDFSGDPDAPGTGALTQWAYNQYTGSLKEKTDADSQDAVYTYTDGGRIDTKTQANGAVTSYKYDFETTGTTSWKKGGYLLEINYSGTPGGDDVLFYSGSTLGYDRLGRNTFSEKNSMETTRTYNLLSLLESESYSGTGAVLENYSVEYDYDDYGRRTRVEVKDNGVSKNKITYGYASDTGRREWITNGVYKAKYGYASNSSLISSIEFYNGSTRKMTSLKDYDFLNRTVSVDSEIESSGKHIGFGYQYNLASQRTQISREDGSHWKYGYDSLGQVISGQRYWSDGTRVIGQQFGYDYDDIGNRIHSYAGGDADGSNMRTTGYTHNDVNEMTVRDLSGYVEIQGVAPLSSVVSVNSQAADRQGEYYRKELSVSTTSAAAYTGVTVSGTGLTSSTGKVFTPKDADILTYDASGNLTQDGRWDYIWDGENRLVKMVTRSSVAGISGFPFRRLEFVYDTQGRRIEKRVYNVASGGSEITHKKYLYDGWNLLMEVDAINSSNSVTYTWGLDLSGADQGAGGVGGLLMIHDSSTHFVAMDGNGNVAALTDGTEVTGQYEYDPFGNLLRVTGSAGIENPFRFSTKYWDEETGLVYYGFRYYLPIIGRWINRDPIEEDGGLNLYGMTNNNPINLLDFLGHKTKKTYEIKFVGARRIDPWSGYKFGNVTKDSRAHKEALNDVIDYFDCDNDRLLTKNDFPPFRIKILGYSWGGWSALKLTHDLATIVSNTSDLRVAIGTLDPVATLRGFGLGKQTLPSYVVKAWNVYQRNGNRYALGNLLGFPFKGFAVKGALGAGPGGKENVSKFLLPHIKTGKLQLVDHTSIQVYRGNLFAYVKSVKL